MMKRLTMTGGSVLMEFIIVLPIYFFLLGTVFVVGELALHASHLSASGDRNVAMWEEHSYTQENTDAFWKLMKQVLSLDRDAVENREAEATDYSYAGDIVHNGRASVSQFGETMDMAQHVAAPQEDETGAGHWTEAVAGRALDQYTLTPLARSLVEFWFYNVEDHVYDGKGLADTSERIERTEVDEILDRTAGNLGRIGQADRMRAMKGNYYRDNLDREIRRYGYFSLRRADDGRWKDGEEDQSYRYWSAQKLASDEIWNWRMAALSKYDDVDAFDDGYEHHDRVAYVDFDPELYVTEGSGGERMRPIGRDPDPGVEYDFKDLL